MSNEFLKAIATMPPNIKRVFVALPEKHQDTVLDNLSTFTDVINRQAEFYASLGLEPDEIQEKLVRSTIQSYVIAR